MQKFPYLNIVHKFRQLVIFDDLTSKVPRPFFSQKTLKIAIFVAFIQGNRKIIFSKI